MRRTVVMSIAACVLAALLGCALAAESKPVAEDKIQKVREAAPEKATAKPAKPRKMLVFTLCKGFTHGAIPLTSKALEIMGEKTGAYSIVVSDDVEMFRPEKLKEFDAVCLNNTTGTLFEDAELKKSLLEFVKGGKGLVGIHAATDCFYKWPEFGEMIGGYFNGHPYSKINVKVDDPQSPLTTVFEGRNFDITDEIYVFKDPYSRARQRVLLSIDVEKTPGFDPAKGKREDKDYAVAWVRSHGQGRVFYCSLGHRDEIWWNPQILRFYLDGIQFALGDLKADTTPSAPAASPEPPATGGESAMGSQR